MLGAIIGDVVGSVYEGRHLKKNNFKIFTKKSRVTDDTILTIATMDAILHDRDYASYYKKYYKKYPNAGYGSAFKEWGNSEETKGYNSWGNGSAMRVSPIAYAFTTIDDVLFEAKKSAEVTHDHEEGVKGAQALASAIFYALNGKTKDYIKEFIETEFDYDLSFSHEDLINGFTYSISCQDTVPLSICSFLNSDSFMDCITKSMLYGADTDTLACMAGAIAETNWDIPDKVSKRALKAMDNSLLSVYERFIVKYKGV